MPSRAAKLVVALAVFVTIGVVLLGPVVGTVNSNTGTQTITNETHAVDFNQSVDLRGYEIDPASETVYGYNETASAYETVPESDYTLHTGNGSISLNSSSTLLDEGEDFKISYDYQASDGLTTVVTEFIPVGMALFILVAVANHVRGVM